MPIYEYRCDKCGHEIEAWQKITEKPKKTCPHCGKRTLQRLISATAFHLKGSGWYVTDYAGKKTSSEKDKETKKSKDKTENKTSASD